jgi:hypothetical protein
VECLREPRDRARLLGALRALELDLKSGGGAPRALFDRFIVEGIGTQSLSEGRA